MLNKTEVKHTTSQFWYSNLPAIFIMKKAKHWGQLPTFRVIFVLIMLKRWKVCINNSYEPKQSTFISLWPKSQTLMAESSIYISGLCTERKLRI